MSEAPRKAKMVFTGGKRAPTGYKPGQVVELPERYLTLPWFKPLPPGENPPTGSFVALKTETEHGKTPPRIRAKPWTPALMAEGKFKMRFRNEIDGHRIKGAPSNYTPGHVYDLSLRHANLPWWELVDGVEGVVIPEPGPHDSNYRDAGDAPFVPPEALDFEEQKGVTMPGPYTDKELEALRSLKAETPDFPPLEDIDNVTNVTNVRGEPSPLPTEQDLKKARKIDVVAFIKEHGGAASMRMNLEDLRAAALSILEALKT